MDAFSCTPGELAWLKQQFRGVTDAHATVLPSEWAEENRYLPPSVTPLPGFYSFDVAPYLREIVDCLAPSSPVRELSFMKGVQVCATVGVLENAIGYYIAHVQSSPMMLVTADSELAKLRMESYITPMLQSSGLLHLIQSADEKNTRKSGKTDRKIEWVGGGFLIPIGAQNANKLRTTSIEIVLRDEVDAWPDQNDKGDSLQLSADRAAAFEGSRKIVDISTPLIAGTSKIHKRFLRGDQRYYFIRCLKCSFPQVLRWRVENPETGAISGITWELQNGILVPDSVRYLCQECGHPHTNDDKARLLSPDHGAEWKPTAVPEDPHHRSYHLSALYSPPSMQTWAAQVLKWLAAWDVVRNRMKDQQALQVFYNNVLGEPFEVRSEKVRFSAVSPHKRSAYHFGQIPNKWCEQYCGGPVLLINGTVDVQADNLAVSVWGWCKDRRAMLIDYWRFEGNTEHVDDPKTWGRLDKLIGEKVYTADDGKKYRLSESLTLIDSGYRTDVVYQYCDTFNGGVFPIKGREKPPTTMPRDFVEFKSPTGLIGYLLTVDNYKDRWGAALRREWDAAQGLQPVGFFNAPHDITDAQLKELTVESKVQRAAKSSGQDSGFEWRRIPGAPNELWDLLIYGNAGLELVCWDYCRNVARQTDMNWPLFYERCLAEKLFFTT